jgi:four helix bundle protein
MEQSKQVETGWIERSHRFAVRVVKLANKLPKAPAGWSMANQIVRSGPSIVMNLEEAKAALTLPDTLHKTGIARKEACETRRALLIIQDAELLPSQQPELTHLIAEATELIAMFTAGTKRLQSRIKNNAP